MADIAPFEKGGPKGQMELLRALASTIRARAEYAAAMGRSFHGKRNLPDALGYLPRIEIEDYWNRYKRNSVAARVVEAYPLGTWRGIGELIEDPDPKTKTEFETEWAKLSKRLKIWPNLRRVDILSGIGRFGVLLIGGPGGYSTALPRRVDPDSIGYLMPYSERDVKITSLDLNTKSPRFGEPLMYEFTRLVSDEHRKFYENNSKIHWTRVIHVAEGLLDDNIYGPPRQEKVWDRLDDLEKVVGGGSEAFWLRAHQGYLFGLDPETQVGPTEEDELDEEVEAFVHGMSRAIRGRGLDVKALGSDVAEFDKNIESILGLIAAGTGIPQRILSGSERGELASQQDRVNWAERVQDRRMEYAGPFILEALVDRFIAHGILPTPKQYEVRWPQIFDLSDDERAVIATRWTDLNLKNKTTVVTVNEIRDRVLGLPPIDEAQAKKEDEARNPVKDPAQGDPIGPTMQPPNRDDRPDKRSTGKEQ